MNYKRLIILQVIFFISCGVVISQEDIEKRVQVTKAYQPKVEKAYKINELPEISDTTTTEVNFNYYLLPKRIETDFQVEPIPAATMVGEPLTELYSRYINLGMGSKISPYAEFYITTKRNENRVLGAYLKHHSSGGKVSLRNNERVFAGYSDTDVKLFGKQIYKNSALQADLGLNNQTRYFYGYQPQMDTTLEKSDIKQNFLRLNAMLDFHSTHTDSMHLNYDLTLDFDHIEDNFNTSEDRIGFDGKLTKFINNNIVGLNTGFDYLTHESTLDTGTNTLVRFNPWIAKFGEGWKLKGGVNFVADASNGDTKLRIFPVASLEYDIINQYIIPYAGVDGNVDLNSYHQITRENPFVLPGLNVENTINKMMFYAGIKGNMSSSTYYNAGIKYTFFDHMPFYYNSIALTDSVGNKFDVIYDDGEKLNLYGELSFEFSEDFTFRTSGNYYQYTLYNESRAWHKPLFDLTFSVRYNLRDKIILQSDLYMTGKRWVKTGLNGDPVELDGFADLNVGIEYRYSKVLSGYLKIKNILSDNYSHWNYYPVYGLQAYVGLTYAF